MIKISVIIPMFNVAPYLPRCINSVYNQSLEESRFELIIVNDGSPDNSLEVAQDLTKDKTNVKIISQENKGLGGARNTGILHAEGDYVLFLDADDWYIENSLHFLLNKIKNEDLIEFSVSVRKNNFNELSKIEFPVTQTLNGLDYYFKYKSINSACNKIYKRSFLLKSNILFQEKIYGEDFDFNSSVIFFAKKVKSIQDLIIVFFQSENSITRNKNEIQKKKYILDYIAILNNLRNSKIKYAHTTAEKYYFDYRMTEKNVTLIIVFLKSGLSFDFYKEITKELYSQNLLILNKKMKIKKYEFVRLVRRYFSFTFSTYIFLHQYFSREI